MLRTVQVMPSALVMIRLLPLLATATSTSRCGDQQRQVQVLSAAEVRLVQVLPSGEVITRLPVPLLLNATSRPSSAAQQSAIQLLVLAALRRDQLRPSLDVITRWVPPVLLTATNIPS